MTLSAIISNSYPSHSFSDSNSGNPYPIDDISEEQPASRDNVAASNNNELSEEEKQQVQELKNRDKEVRAHEMAHVAAGGQYIANRASFGYQAGPDGKRYAVGGEVSIDTSKVNSDPEATIRKMQVVRKAALAPAKPSPQDRSVAAQATQKEMQARQELREEQSAEDKESLSNKNQGIPSTASYTETGKAVSSSSTLTSRHFDIIA